LADALGFEPVPGARDPRDHIPLIRVWRLALDVEALQLHRTQVVAGPGLPVLERLLTEEADTEEILRTWHEIADVAITGPAALDVRDLETLELAEFSRPWGPRALGELYRAESADVEDLVDELVELYEDEEADDLTFELVGAATRTGLLAAHEAGVVEVTLSADAELPPPTGSLLGEPPWAVYPIPGTTVTLTSLGRYFVRENLLAEGADAPLIPPS
jgi:hypothetical protein